MRPLLLFCLLLTSFTTYQPEGKSVIEFNAGFNAKNSYKDLNRLENAKLFRVDIQK